MNTWIDAARTAAFHDGQIVGLLHNGGDLRFLVAGNPRLAKGTPEQLNNIEISPFWLH